MPFIQHRLHGSIVHCYELSHDGASRLTLGRSAECDIVIDDATVSGEHAVFELSSNGEVSIVDTGSTNGILVNSKPVEHALLSTVDHIVIGTHELNLLDSLSDDLSKTLKIKKSWIPGVYYTSDK